MYETEFNQRFAKNRTISFNNEAEPAENHGKYYNGYNSDDDVENLSD